MPNLATLAGTAPWQWPDSARNILLDALRNPGSLPSDRVLAAELLGHVVVMDDQVAHALLSILHDDQAAEALRAQAAISLGPILEQADVDGFDDPDMVPITEKTFREIQRTLHKLYADTGAPELVRRRALEAAVRAPQDWQKAALRTAWSSDDDGWKVTAMCGMGYVHGFEDEILEALQSPNENIHYEAVVAAGEMEVKAAWRHIVSLLTSGTTDKALLLAAIGAVATIRPDEAREVLADLAASDDPEVIEAVRDALTTARGLSEEDDEDEDLDKKEIGDDLDEDLDEEGEPEDWGDEEEEGDEDEEDDEDADDEDRDDEDREDEDREDEDEDEDDEDDEEDERKR
jgi:hypothetical protein